MSSDYTATGATLSIGNVYRYHLWRQWADPPAKSMCFVMLNPSTADSLEDDPTIRRCVGFAKREGCTRLDVVNLFAYRATDPKALLQAHARGIDIVGRDNLAHVQRVVMAADIVVLAYGNRAMDIGVSITGSLEDFLERGTDVRYWLAWASAGQRPFYRLGSKTKEGQPRHPLYLAKDTPLEPWV